MSIFGIPADWWGQLALLAVLLALTARPLGHTMAKVFMGERTRLSPLIAPLEALTYRLCRIDPKEEMSAGAYTKNLMLFSLVCGAALFATLLLQSYPLVAPDTALNIAASFITGTNWQAVAPETTVTEVTQMIGITVQNFLSAAVGMAVFLALTRGLTRERAETVGNFWVDCVRGVLYIFLPLCLLFALLLMSQGVVQTFSAFETVQTLEGGASAPLTLGPMASVGAVKQIGTNGGGYTFANAAHPFENPTPLSNFMQLFAMLLVPVASCFAYGKMTGHKKQGTAVLAAMILLFIPFALLIANVEQAGNPLLAPLGIDQHLGNMEGKELRFGGSGASLWAALTTATSNGATNAALDSFLPLSAGATLFLIHIGEIIFGGAGSGFYVMLSYILLTVFIAGLMIGRGPEYLGKKIGTFEIQMISIILLIPVLFALLATALALWLPSAQGAATNPGAQGFNQIFYAFSTTANNNGAGLGGILADTPFYNITFTLCILAGRFGVIAATLAIAGSMAAKGVAPLGKRSFDTTAPLFVFVLIFVILMAAMAYIPAVLLGFGHEHFQLLAGGL